MGGGSHQVLFDLLKRLEDGAAFSEVVVVKGGAGGEKEAIKWGAPHGGMQSIAAHA